MGMVEANAEGRASALQALAQTLAEAIDACDDDRMLPQLARQYRETVRELAEFGEPSNSLGGILDGLDAVR